MVETCFLCTEVLKTDPEWQLQCASCDRKLHYACGIGYAEPVKAFRISQGKQQYNCPICIVAQNYDFLHLALKQHETKARDRNAEEVGVESVDTESQNSDSAHSQTAEAPPASPGPGDPGASPAPSEHGDADVTLNDGRRRSRTSTMNSGGVDFRVVVSRSEQQRIARCKKVLYNLKNVPSSVDTVILLDSNGNNIKSEDIDGGGNKLCLRQVGGLCVSATTSALKQCRVRYPKIKKVVYGLGTNDHLHAHEHAGERTKYIKELDHVTRKTFPNAQVHFILPFSAIEGLGEGYTKNLAKSISVTHVGWKVHTPPSMKHKLMSPAKIHINPSGRVIFTLWLRKLFAPNPPVVNVLNAWGMPTSTPGAPAHAPGPSSYATALVGNSAAPHQPPSSVGLSQAPPYNGLSRDVYDFVAHMMSTWRRDPVNPSINRLQPSQWPPAY